MGEVAGWSEFQVKSYYIINSAPRGKGYQEVVTDLFLEVAGVGMALSLIWSSSFTDSTSSLNDGVLRALSLVPLSLCSLLCFVHISGYH